MGAEFEQRFGLPWWQLALTAKVVQFNDLASLEAAPAPEDVACVLAEPALTTIGIVLPCAR